MLHKFYLTFGQRYSREEHPTFKLAHPNGVLEIIVDDTVLPEGLDAYTMARSIAAGITSDDDGSPRYSMIDNEEHYLAAKDKYFPGGILATVEYKANVAVSELF